MATVVLAGTLDTKGREYAYVRDRLREDDVDVLLIDAGVLGEPIVTPDIAREAVAEAGGANLGELAQAGDRGRVVGRGVEDGRRLEHQHRGVELVHLALEGVLGAHAPIVPEARQARRAFATSSA